MQNHLYYGDNLDILRKFIPDDSVDLCYIDPPFNSKRNYNQIYTNQGKEDFAQSQAFVDTWVWDDLAVKGFSEIIHNENGVFTDQCINLILGLKPVLGEGSLLAYLVSVALRCAEIFRVLKPTGSFYFHCDPTSSHYIKLVLDSIFCPQRGMFLNEIIWCYRGGGSSRSNFGKKHDVIFRYSKSKKYIFNSDSVRIPYEAEGKGRKDDAMWGKHKGTNKVYKPHPKGKVPEDWWQMNPLNSNDPERLGYPTQKPERLLARIVEASSSEGDVVLDAYCGCGTTVAVAQKLNRKWIGIDITYQAVSLILKRLEDAYGTEVLELDQLKVAGIPRDRESAQALATRKDDRTRKEFEKWAVLTYTRNRAIINQKKGADKGIDGTVFFLKNEGHGRMIFQVKSGKVKSGDIRDLRGTIEREDADAGVFITLNKPSKAMIREAKSAKFFHHEAMDKDYPRIEIVTVDEILNGKQIEIPLSLEVLRSAERKQKSGKQLSILATESAAS